MRGQKPRNETLAKEFGQRLKKISGNISQSKLAEKLDNIVSQKTLWDYINGLSMPRPDALLKIAEKFNVSVDWLLKGNDSEIPQNEQEKRFLRYYREAHELNVADKIEHFAKYTIEEASREKGEKNTSEAA